MLKQFLHKGMKGFAISLLLAIAMVVGVVVSSEARLASTNRHAVVMEAYYALDPAHYGFSSKLYNGWTVSDWKYLATDTNAYDKEKSWYGSNSSVPSYSLFYTNLEAYSYRDGYGRGGQCKYFVDTLLFRSEAATRINGTHVLPTYSAMSNSTRPIGYTRPGDVIFRTNGTPHVASVVQVLSGNSDWGNVTSVDVVDSNYVGGNGQEIIARHIIQGSELSNYRIYTGVSYYWEPYYPW